MPVRFPRKKSRHLLISLLYRLNPIGLLPVKTRMQLYLDLEWFFRRMSLETSAKLYAPLTDPWKKDTLDFILPRLRKNHFVVDFGCKFGHFSAKIAPHVLNVTGIDHDSNAIARARELYGNVSNLKFSISAVEVEAQHTATAHRLAILSHILEHLDEPELFLEGLSKTYEEAYIEVPDFNESYLNVLRQHSGSTLLYSDEDHIWEFTRTDMQALILNSGFSIKEEHHTCGMLRFWCTSAIQNQKQETS